MAAGRWKYKQFICSCGHCGQTAGDIAGRPAVPEATCGAAANRVALVTRKDECRWDARYTTLGPPPVSAVEPPYMLGRHADLFPAGGRALDVACGQGLGAVWLARRGLDVWGLDISPVAISRARDLARREGVDDRCRFDVADLDDGLP